MRHEIARCDSGLRIPPERRSGRGSSLPSSPFGLSVVEPGRAERRRQAGQRALEAAGRLPGAAGEALHQAALVSFIDGVQLAVTVGSVLALIAAVIVYRYLPRQLSHEGAMHGGVEAMEDAAELGLAGVPPVFPDEEFPGDDDRRVVPDPAGA